MTVFEEVSDDLNVLSRQYYQLLEPNAISWPAGKVLKEYDVQAWLFARLFDQSKMKYLPPERYRLRIIKHIVAAIEKSITDPQEEEISEDLMSVLSTLMVSNLPSEAQAAQEKAYVTYTFISDHEGTTADPRVEYPVTLLESRAVISGLGTTGLRTWEAAIYLASFLTTEQGRCYVQGMTILELGGGTGLLSILCSKYLNAKRVVCTDGVETVVDAITTNLFLNDLNDNALIESAALKWGHHLEAKSIEEDYAVRDLEIVMGADVTFDRRIIPALVSTLWQLFQLRPGLQVLISATIRNEDTFAAFEVACSESFSKT